MPLNTLTPEFLCSNLKRSLDFYTGMLGFQILFDRPEHKFAYLEREGAHIMLEELGAGREWITGELDYPFGRGVNFQIAVSDATGLYNSIQKETWPVYLPLEEKWYRNNDVLRGNRQFIIQDPDGYLLRFAQDLGSKPVSE
jgi:catechol 2,3-dioxygenase-like lactoylglutathione lyase family enzyme